MTPDEISEAIARAEAAIADAVRTGNRPDAGDLLLLQHLQLPRTFGERLQSSAFPLVVVIIALAVMALLATNRPPVIEVTGEAHTMAMSLELQADLSPDRKLGLTTPRSASVDFRASGFETAFFGHCPLVLSGQNLGFTATGIVLPLSGTTSLSIESDRLEGSFGGPMPKLSFFLTAKTSNIAEAYGVVLSDPDQLDAACRGLTTAELDPGATPQANAAITVPRVEAADFPDFLSLPPGLPVSRVTFGHWETAGRSEFCALKSARMRVEQKIRLLDVSETRAVTPPTGTCFEILNGTVTVIPAADGSFRVRFSAAVANVDDGIPPHSVGATYLEILTSDPHIGLILGAITYILTTIWGIAVVTREFLTR